MIAIARVVLREIALDLVEPFAISSGTVSARRIVLVELRSTDGEEGWGECIAGETPHYSEETTDTAWWALSRWFAPRLLAAPFADPHELAPRLADGVKGHPMAKAAIEMAAFDLAARRAGVPLARFLGGTRETIEVGLSIGLQPRVEDLVARALAARDRGYRRIKLKIAPGRDLDRVRAVREALGPEATLSVDANAAYGLEDAELFRALDELGLLMIEQPLAEDDLRRHALLQRELRTPLCLDESIRSDRDLEDMIALGSGRALNVKPGRVGGLASSLALHARARAAGLPIWCGGMLESGIGRAHNVALASLPGFVWPGDISPSRRYWHEDVVDPEWTMSDDGRVAVPLDRPGLGVAVRRDRIEALAVRRLEIDAETPAGA
ncbi:MAG: o-succinylbenzoate synthase [Planctomycetota bacterium]